MKDTTMTCKFCGRKIGIITWGVLGKEVDPYEHTGAAEPAYRVHRKNCYRSVYR